MVLKQVLKNIFCLVRYKLKYRMDPYIDQFTIEILKFTVFVNYLKCNLFLEKNTAIKRNRDFILLPTNIRKVSRNFDELSGFKIL